MKLIKKSKIILKVINIKIMIILKNIFFIPYRQFSNFSKCILTVYLYFSFTGNEYNT
jgi:hypothetical protein